MFIFNISSSIYSRLEVKMILIFLYCWEKSKSQLNIHCNDPKRAAISLALLLNFQILGCLIKLGCSNSGASIVSIIQCRLADSGLAPINNARANFDQHASMVRERANWIGLDTDKHTQPLKAPNDALRPSMSITTARRMGERPTSCSWPFCPQS